MGVWAPHQADQSRLCETGVPQSSEVGGNGILENIGIHPYTWGFLSLGVWVDLGADYMKWCIQERGVLGVPGCRLRWQVYENDVRVQVN